MSEQSRRPWSAPEEPKGPGTQVAELKTLVVDYAKQETVDPLKTLGRYLGFGIGGSLLIGIGAALWVMAVLRGLQRIDTFQDPTWGWVPYLVAVVVGLIIVGFFLWRLSKATSSTSTPPPHDSTTGEHR